MKRLIKKILKPLFPPNSLRRRAVKKVLQKLHLRNYTLVTYYNTAMQQRSMYPEINPKNELPQTGPLISIVVPMYNTPARYLWPMVYSIVSQSYPNWELLLADGSSDKAASERIAAVAAIDTRIRVIPNKTSKGIPIGVNTNHGLAVANGEYIALCDHDDLLDPYALSEVVRAISEHQAEFIYSDEDKISDNGDTYFDPHYKPDWSPDLFTHVNYLNHLTVIKKSLVDKVGGFDTAKDGAQDYDLYLRITDLNPVIYHIPKVLYHWRAADNSTAQDFSSKRHITDAASAALKAHFTRKHIDVTVTPKVDRPGF